MDESGEMEMPHAGITGKLLDRICEWIDYETTSMVNHPNTDHMDGKVEWLLLGKYKVMFSAKSNTESDISDDVKWPRRLWAKNYRNEMIPMFMCTPRAKELLEKYLQMDFKSEIEPMLEPLKFLGCPRYVDPLDHAEAPYRLKKANGEDPKNEIRLGYMAPQCPNCETIYVPDEDEFDEFGMITCTDKECRHLNPEWDGKFYPPVADNGYELKGIVLFEQFLYDVMKYWCDFDLVGCISRFELEPISEERAKELEKKLPNGKEFFNALVSKS